MPPSAEAVRAMEDSNAKTSLLGEASAAGAYDKVPFSSASAIFTMDTSNDIFLLHSLQVLSFASRGEITHSQRQMSTIDLHLEYDLKAGRSVIIITGTKRIECRGCRNKKAC